MHNISIHKALYWAQHERNKVPTVEEHKSPRKEIDLSMEPVASAY
jgi:hypothetical protein